MNIILSSLIFVLGLSIGSFLSVVVYRLHENKKGMFFSRSICPHCNKPLKAKHLIPVISWLFLKGKCAYCRKKISPHYFLLELLTGCVFLLIFITWNFVEPISSTTSPEILNYIINYETFAKFGFHILVFTILIAIFFYDLLYKEIPDILSFPLIAINIAGGLYFNSPTPESMMIGSLLIAGFFALQYLVSKGKWIGGGDIRLGLVIGTLLGIQKGILAVIGAYVIGAIISIILLLKGAVSKKTAIPFGPFLTIGIIISLFYGTEIIDWYLSYITN